MANTRRQAVPFRGGLLTWLVLGHRWQRRGDDWKRDHVEYVLRVSWQPSTGSGGGDSSLSRVWIVAGRFSEFRALHEQLQRTAGDRRTSLPRFPSRHWISSTLLSRNRREVFIESRERRLARYMAELLAVGSVVLSSPAVDELLQLSRHVDGRRVMERSMLSESARSFREMSRRLRSATSFRSSRHMSEHSRVDDDDGDDDRAFGDAEWLDYQLKLRLMELVDDSDEDPDADDDSGRRRVRDLVESVELLKPQLATAARVPHHTAQATMVLKKFADSLGIYKEINQRARRRTTL